MCRGALDSAGGFARRRLINEITTAEETDEDGRGGYASHFELYRRAMAACGADTRLIDDFLQRLAAGDEVRTALARAELPPAVRRFVGLTFDTIEQGDVCQIAAAFTFGREDLLPDVFQKIVDELNVQAGGELQEFQYYLLRHVELDGGEHGPMAERLVNSLCGNDAARWQAATDSALTALHARLEFWDAIHRAIRTANGQ